MQLLDYREQQIIFKKGQRKTHLCVITSGSVSYKIGNQKFYLDAGALIGLMEVHTDTYLFDYVAQEDTKIVCYPVDGLEDLYQLIEEKTDFSYAFLHASLVQARDVIERYVELKEDAGSWYSFVMESYQEYRSYCDQIQRNPLFFRHLKNLQQMDVKQSKPQWELDYYMELSSVWEADMKEFYEHKIHLCIGECLRCAELLVGIADEIVRIENYVHQQADVLIHQDKDDLLAVFFDWTIKLANQKEDIGFVQMKVRHLQSMIDDFQVGYSKEEIDDRFMEYWSTDFDALSQSDAILSMMSCDEFLELSLAEKIMEFADYEAEKKQELLKLLEISKHVADIHDTSDEISQLRKLLTKHFYDLYEKAFLLTRKIDSVPIYIEIFLRFGLLDLELVSTATAKQLYEINLLFQKGGVENLYTMYDWLVAIYKGYKVPSRNDFDQDYVAYLTDLLKQHRIQREEVERLKDNAEEKVKFEIHNMFVVANRATYGRVISFCPVLVESDFLRTPMEMLCSSHKLIEALDTVRRIDFSCFYREVFFQDQEHEISQTQIYKEVLPEIILMPNVGTRAMMWQELSGVKKNTPARFLFPLFSMTDLLSMMTEVCARYRWEICRRIMGVRWNDIREKSLTSEYSDYLQCYRKNSDISVTNREKIKQQLTKAKNNYRDFFVIDYCNWMKYESKGNLRLNSVARRILSAYCPFSKSIRTELKDNPLFRDLFAQYEIQKEKQYQKQAAIWNRYQESGGVLTEELKDNLKYYQM